MKLGLLITCILFSRCSGRLIAYWSFNENSGLVCEDRLGKSCAFIRKDALSEHQNFIKSIDGFGNCLSLDNSKQPLALHPTSEYLELSKTSVLNFGKKNFTVTGWFKAESQLGRRQFVISNCGVQSGFALCISFTESELFFDVEEQEKFIKSDSSVADNKWHWFAAGVNNKNLFLYVDGIEQKGKAVCSAVLSYDPTAEVARNKGLIGVNFTGFLDDLAVFNTALSEKELKEIRQNGLKKYGFAPDAAAVQKCQPENSPFKVTERVIFDGYKGLVYNDRTYRLACASIITEAPNNDLLVWCITGSENEPASDNSVLIVRSADGGKTWGEPEMLVPATDKMMAVASNIYSLADRRMVALWAYLPPEKKYTEWHYYRMYSDDSGKSWSKPELFPIRNNSVALFEGRPLKLANGEYFFAGSFFDKREKPLVAPISELLKAKTEEQAAAMPAGQGKTAGKFATHLHGCMSFTSKNEDATGLTVGGTVANRPLGLLEPTCVQLKNGSIAMLMRGQYGGFLWWADSFDNGRTWTNAYQTDIPNPSSMAHLLRLPDG
ncbi:MAG: sialidase family protein, partial [Sedimentisphaerales bacterium]